MITGARNKMEGVNPLPAFQFFLYHPLLAKFYKETPIWAGMWTAVSQRQHDKPVEKGGFDDERQHHTKELVT